MTKAVTLSPAKPNVTLSGDINALGVVGTYAISVYSGGDAYPSVISAAIFGAGATAFTLTNTGTISSSGTARLDAGIVLGAPGTIINACAIEAAAGIFIFGTAGTGLVRNSGLIEANNGDGIYLQGAGIAANAGTINAAHTGIFDAGGDIANTGTIIAGGDGIFQKSGNAQNSGIIRATGVYYPETGTIGGAGVETYGKFTNQSAGIITATYGVGLVAVAFAGVYNTGTITGAYGIDIGVGSSLYNSGFISGSIAGIAISQNLNIGHSFNQYINNYAGGIIEGGSFGIEVTNNAAYIYNSGIIGGATAIQDSGTIMNLGQILGTETGIALSTELGQSAALLENFGLINASSGIGIAVTNGATIVDSGTIIGAGGTAISFSKGHANILELTPTATIIGAIDLNGTLNLEAGAKTGTLNAAALQNVKAFTIAKSASWDLTNSFAGNALTNNGTLDETGRLTLTGNLTGAGTIILGAAPLTLEAGAAKAQKIAFSGTAETLALGDPAKFAGTIQHFAPADTIDLTGLAIGNLETMSFAHGKLTLAATTGTYTITFAKPTQFSGETFSAFAGGAGTAITLAAAAMAFLPSPTIAAPNFLPITH